MTIIVIIIIIMIMMNMTIITKSHHNDHDQDDHGDYGDDSRLTYFLVYIFFEPFQLSESLTNWFGTPPPQASFLPKLEWICKTWKGGWCETCGSTTEVMQNSTNMYAFTWNMWHTTIQLESTIYTWCLFCKELTPPPPSPHMAIATPHLLTLLHPYNFTSKQFLLNPPKPSFLSLDPLFPHSLFHFPPHSASRQRQPFSERIL